MISKIKEEKEMTKSFTTIYTIITKAAAEAGIKDNENYTVKIISNSDLLEFELETEWAVTTCYADMESTQILGLMTENKTLEKLIDGTVEVRRINHAPFKAA
jgi:hypothetical protein